jgi:uncharacterized protein YbbC (DUF1343 family)
MSLPFQYGVDVLLAEHGDWLRGRRVGLVAHAASVDAAGVPSAERLRAAGVNLTALFGPEHGFAGLAVAGEEVGDARHGAWNIPIHSLYGATRKPTPAMLADVDVLLFDLQDLGVRCYTYSATLRNVLEAAVESHKAVIVLDRPVPLAGVVDGPLPDTQLMSFVAAIPTPFCYGLTPGQTALWLRAKLNLDLELRVAPCRGTPPPERWLPPSPAIRSPAHALAYPATVLFEAFPALDVGRKTEHAFQGLENHTELTSKDWKEICEVVSRQLSVVSGSQTNEHRSLTTDHCGVCVEPLDTGLRIRVTALESYRPALVGVALAQAVQQVWGAENLWQKHGARPEWFVQLLGTDRVRLALLAGAKLAEIGAMWEKDVSEFRREGPR